MFLSNLPVTLFFSIIIGMNTKKGTIFLELYELQPFEHIRDCPLLRYLGDQLTKLGVVHFIIKQSLIIKLNKYKILKGCLHICKIAQIYKSLI